jgi:cell division protein FtsL
MEGQKEKSKNKRRKKNAMTVLGGGFLIKEKFSKQFPFMVYVTLLFMAIITNTYIAEERNRELTKTSKHLNDLQVEYVQLKSAIMDASKQSVLVKRLAGTGLKEATEPLKRINVNEEPIKTEEP